MHIFDLQIYNSQEELYPHQHVILQHDNTIAKDVCCLAKYGHNILSKIMTKKNNDKDTKAHLMDSQLVVQKCDILRWLVDWRPNI